MQNYAWVSLSTGAFKVYGNQERTTIIGYIYPNECFTYAGFSESFRTYTIYFRNAAGVVQLGYVDDSIRYAPYNHYKVSNGVLVPNPYTNGYYIHTIKPGYNMNWYIGTTRQNTPLPGGTELYSDDCAYAGEEHPYRILFQGYKIPGGEFVRQSFWIDYLTLGSLVSNRVIL